MIDLSAIDVSAFPHWLSPGGEVLLINADCMAVLPLLPKVDAVVTDPPYGVGFKYESHVDSRAGYREWCARWFESLKCVSPIIFFSCGIVNVGMWMQIEQPRWIAAWLKPAAMKRSPFGFCNWEPMLIYGKPLGNNVDVFTAMIVPDVSLDGHPCPKPLKWGIESVARVSLAGDTILDPFAGSFTTAVACISTQRQCIAIEIDPKYFAIGKRRCEEALAIGSLFDPAALAAPNLFEETQ